MTLPGDIKAVVKAALRIYRYHEKHGSMTPLELIEGWRSVQKTIEALSPESLNMIEEA